MGLNNPEEENMNKNISVSYLSIKSILLLIFLVIFIGLIFNGCTRHGPFSARGIAYADTIPNTVKLSNYKAIQVNVTSNIKESDKVCSKLQDKIIEILTKKKLFDNILKGEAPQDAPVDLQLNAEIVALKKVTTAERMFLDDFVGESEMVVVNRLKDLKTGNELGTFTAGGESASGGLAATFGAGTTKQTCKLVAKKIVKYIQTHM